MNIRVNTGIYNNNGNSQIGDMVRPEEASVTTNLRSLASQITDLNVGDVFTGQISGINGRAIELLLSDKSSIQAKLSSFMQLQMGQTMSFEVSSNNNGKVQLTPLYANLSGESQVARALGEAGLPHDARNSEMVQSMMEQGMKIDADSLLSMSKTVNTFPNAAPSSIVSMTALKIPLTDINVQEFEVYRNNAHQIADHAGGIAGGFAEVASESLELNRALLDIFTGKVDPAISEYLNEEMAQEGEVPEGAQAEASKDAQAAVDPKSAGAAEGDAAVKNQTEGSAGGDAKTVITEEGLLREQMGKGDGVRLEITSGRNISPKAGFYGDNTVTEDLKELYTPEERENLASELKKLGVPDNIADRVREGDLNTRDTLNLVRSAMDQADKAQSVPEGREGQTADNTRASDDMRSLDTDPSDSAKSHEQTAKDPGTLQEIPQQEDPAANFNKIRHMLKTPEFSKLVKNEIMNELLMKPEDIADKEKIQEYFQKVIRDTAQAAEVLKASGHGQTTLASGNQELHDNIDFMNQLNQVFTYVQVPLKMASEAQHGDLYVYTNKKKLQSGDGNVSALLHLDMKHLGTMDIHVAMKPSGNVNTHFILQKEEMLDFIAEHLPELDERIKARGYNISSDVSLNKEKTSVPDIMFNKGKDTRLIQYTAFDAKA